MSCPTAPDTVVRPRSRPEMEEVEDEDHNRVASPPLDVSSPHIMVDASPAEGGVIAEKMCRDVRVTATSGSGGTERGSVEIASPVPLRAFAAYCDDPMDGVSFISSFRLNLSYAFLRLGNEAVHPNEVYPAGPLLKVKVEALADLVLNFVHLSLGQLKIIGAAHGILVNLRHPKASVTKDLKNHQCNSSCIGSLNFLFKHLVKDRKPARPARPAMRKTDRPETELQEEATSQIDGQMDVDFPTEADVDFTYGLIDLWQSREKILLAGGFACAVCAQNHMAEAMHEVDPDDVDFTLLRNPFLKDAVLPTLYNMTAYDDAILYYKGLQCTDDMGPLNMCTKCKRDLVDNGRQPLDSIANFMYYARNELPDNIKRCFANASMFDIMLVARSRATKITHLFSDKKNHPLEGTNRSMSQRYSRGNVAIMPQDSVSLRNVLPPSNSEIAEAMCALFIGGKDKPTRKNIEKLSPVLVSKQIVSDLLDFLLKNNTWYRTSGVKFSQGNLDSLFSPDDNAKSLAPLRAVEICHLPSETSGGVAIGTSDYTGRQINDDIPGEELIMESVGFTVGERSTQDYKLMKARALAWCLDSKRFIKMQSGTKLLDDREPGLLTYLFPNLDPWGIGGFYEPNRTKDQYISFERQVKNLLLQDDSPFQSDPSFAYVCWNILQKQVVNRNSTFRTKASTQVAIAKELSEVGPTLNELIEKWHDQKTVQASNRKERRALRILAKIRLVAKNLKGSSGYKQCRRNEIRALMKTFSTPALFLTLNPSDLTHPLVGAFGGIKPDEWRAMDKWQRGNFVAKNPCAAARSFDELMKSFIDIILGYGKSRGGLFGVCEAYYGTVEAQGRGTLHCHMLVWLLGNPSPQALRDKMASSPEFSTKMISWIESIICCELPGMTTVLEETDGPMEPPERPPDKPNPQLREPPRRSDFPDDEDFAANFREFVTDLAIECNWHKHMGTCWIHLGAGDKRTDANCRMRIDGSTRALTEIDADTQSILLRRLHPRINNFNDVVLFLMQCNMDIKYIGSGEAAKALVYYVTDYITKNNLAVNVGLGALSYAIKSNENKYENDTETGKIVRDRSLFTKTVNAMMACQEMSHQQVMSYFVGSGDYYSSHNFRLLNVAELERYVCRQVGEPVARRWNKNVFASSIDDESNYVEPNQNEVGDGSNVMSTKPLPDDSLHEHAPDNEDGSDVETSDQEREEITVHITDGEVSVNDYIQDYIYRPTESDFDSLSIWEYTEWVAKVTVKSEDKRKKKLEASASAHPELKVRGRRAKPRGKFSSKEHPQFDSCVNRLKQCPLVPVLLGDALPRCDRSEAEKEDWCRIMLSLFKPWRKACELKEGNQSWTAAFESYQFSPHAMKVIANMNVENECKDARDRYEVKRRSDKSLSLVGGLVGEGKHPDLDSLEVDLLNDSRLDDEFVEGSVSDNLQPDTESSDIVHAAERAGLFGDAACNAVITEETESLGNASLTVDADKKIMFLQANLMTELSKKKRPTPSDGLSDVARGKRRQVDVEPEATLVQLEDITHLHNILPQSACALKPEDELENIISEMGISGNPEQERAVRIVGEHFILGVTDQLFLYVAGVGGTGKSYVIRAIVELFRRCGASNQMLLSAPTGSAAVLIDGYTIHALCFLPKNKYPIDQTKLADLWRNVKYIVIDEISMISALFLAQISERISQARSWDNQNAGKPFGGINVIYMGDFGQLRPVKQHPLFSHALVGPVVAPILAKTQYGQQALHGASLWRQTNRVVELRKNWRSVGDPAFVDLLARVRNGEAWNGIGEPRSGSRSYERSDYDVLAGRRLQVLAAKDAESLVAFKGAPIIVSKKTLRDAINLRMTRMYAEQSGNELHFYYSRDRYQRADLQGERQARMWRARSTVTNDSLGMLPLAIGMKVVLTENVAISASVVNGAQGVLHSLKYEVDDKGRRFATCAYVRVPGCNLQAPGLEKGIVPILAQRSSFKYSGKGGGDYHVSRLQLPLLPAYAFTDYKVQGRGFKHVVVDLASCIGLQSMYVMLSRATSLKSIVILRNFPPSKLYSRLPEEFRNEFRRLSGLDVATREWFEDRHRSQTVSTESDQMAY